MEEKKKVFPTLVEEFLSVERTNLEITNYSIHISRSVKEYSDKLKAEGFKDHHNMARAKANKTYGKFWREKLSMKMTRDINE